MDRKCAGCDRTNIVSHYFPDDYPKSMMLCCACLLACYWYLGASGTPNTHGYLSKEALNEDWWGVYGEDLKKVIVIYDEKKSIY